MLTHTASVKLVDGRLTVETARIVETMKNDQNLLSQVQKYP